jgi:hypothetical protein
VDPRVTAAVAMSPQPVLMPDQKAAFGGIKIPVLHLTGTEDHSPPGLTDVTPADRRIPYDNSPGPAYLVIFKGATHMTFGGWRGAPGGGRRRVLRGQTPTTLPAAEQEAIHQQIEQGTTAFWDAYLKERGEAKAWLAEGLPKALGDRGTFESKGVRRP